MCYHEGIGTRVGWLMATCVYLHYHEGISMEGIGIRSGLVDANMCTYTIRRHWYQEWVAQLQCLCKLALLGLATQNVTQNVTVHFRLVVIGP